MTQQQLTQVCITSYNINIEWFKDWTMTLSRKNTKVIEYIILQGELCKDGKQHIQGFIQFTGKKRLQQIKDIFNDNTLHIEPTKGTPQQARDYCTQEKNGVWHTYEEYGVIDLSKGQGKRTDLIELKERLRNGETLRQITIDNDNNQLQHLLLQYSRPLKELEYIIKQEETRKEIKEEYNKVIWNKLQIHLLDIIDNNKHNRTINWVYDNDGNSGKSYLAKYLIVSRDVYYITGGKQNDILYGYNGQPLIIYDLARTYSENTDHIYTTMENFKNGAYLSTKYETQQKIFKIPTIMVLANFKPNKEKLSLDRWNIIDTDDYQEEEDITNIIIPILKPKKKISSIYRNDD